MRTNSYSRRDILNLGLIGGLASAIGCGPKTRYEVTGRNPEGNPEGNLEDIAKPVVEANETEYIGDFLSLRIKGEYLVGRTKEPVDYLRLNFLDGNGEKQLLRGMYSDSLRPQFVSLDETTFVVPLANFLMYDIEEFGVQLDDAQATTKNGRRVYEFANFRFSPEVTGDANKMPKNKAREHQIRNVVELSRTSQLFVKYQRGFTNEGDGKTTKIAFVVPLGLYDSGVDGDTRIVQRFSEFYVHGTKPFAKSPLPYVRKVIVNEVTGGGLAWSTGKVIVSSSGSRANFPCCEAGQQPLRESTLYLDTHELAHAADFNGLIPNARDFKAISWEREPDDNSIWKRRSDMRPEDFVTGYAETNHWEEVAELIATSIAFGDNVRHRIERTGSKKLRDKYLIIRDDILGGKEFFPSDVALMEAES